MPVVKVKVEDLGYVILNWGLLLSQEVSPDSLNSGLANTNHGKMLTAFVLLTIS
jgi:hypothetical protein